MFWGRMRPDPLPPPEKKGTNRPLLILYSNLLATSIFIETPVSWFCYLSKVQYSHKCMYLTTCLIQLAAQLRCKSHHIILLRLGMLCNVEGFNKFKLFMTTHNNILSQLNRYKIGSRVVRRQWSMVNYCSVYFLFSSMAMLQLLFQISSLLG